MRDLKGFSASLLAGFLFLGTPAFAGPIEDKANAATAIIGTDSDDALSGKDQTKLLAVFSGLTPLQRFRVFQLLDKAQASDLRTIYDRLSATNQARLLVLCNDAGQAATAAGLQQIGVISDVDDTAIPTEYQPDGTKTFKGAADFYNELRKNSPVHYVSARPKLFIPETAAHLA